MRYIFLDYETYYDDEYSLKKMTVPEYICDQRFEVNGAAIKEGTTDLPYWLNGPQLPGFFKSLNADYTVLISHNALFDATITAWKYEFIPKLTFCTLSMARAVLGHKLKSLSLARVASHLGLGVKDVEALKQAKGHTLKSLEEYPRLLRQYMNYAIEDVRMCSEIFTRLLKEFPAEELAVIDMTIRCATQPLLKLDIPLLYEHLYEVQSKKETLLAQTGADKASLMSNDKLSALLLGLDVDPPKKMSLTTGLETYAFAKTDTAFLDLLNHDDIRVQALIAARLGCKSTLEETRTQKFINIGRVTNQSRMPVPLGYGRAHTHRLGGEWGINMQNLPRGGKLRASLVAPERFAVVKADASQIEARITAWFSECKSLTQQFSDGEDVYSSFASKVYHRPINKKDHPEERWIGKGAVLGLGFGMGWVKFQKTMRTQSETQLGKRIELGDSMAVGIVNTYRDTYFEIVNTWNWLRDVGMHVLAGAAPSTTRGPLVFEREQILLPSLQGDIGMGLTLKYLNLQHSNGGFQFEYGGQRKKLFAGKVMENIAQALDRVIVFGAALRLQKKIAPVKLALQAHDELVYVVPEHSAEDVARILIEELSRRPPWAPDLPLAAEAAIGKNYRDMTPV